MNPLDQLLQMLFGQAKPRQDLGEAAPVATFAGRVVHPSDTTQTVMARMPMGSGEGDINAALQATLGSLVQPAMGAATKALAPKLLAMMVPGGRFFHGTPNVFNEFDPARSKSSGLAGPGVAYLTDNPTVASDYAAGATNGVGANPSIQKAIAQGMQPNIRPYLVKTHNSFVTEAPMGAQDMSALLAALGRDLGQSSSGGFQKGGSANRAANAQAAVRAQAGGPGQAVYDTLTNMLGPDRANQVIKNAGFQSIQYPGGTIMGDVQHRAINVLDPAIMQNLFDALMGKPQNGYPTNTQ